jgi:hypothetical protein
MPFKNIAVGHLVIAETNVWLHYDQENKLLLRGVIDIGNISIGNLDKSSSGNIFHFGSVKCSIADLDYFIPDACHTIQLKRLLVDSKKGIFKIDSLKIIPQKIKHETNYIEATLRGIEVSDFDIMQLTNKKFFAGKIIIDESHANIFAGNEVNKSLKTGGSFASFLNQVPEEIRIDSFKIEHSSIELKGLSEEVLQDYKSFFDSMHIKNISVNHFDVAKTNVRIQSNEGNQFTIEQVGIDSLSKSVKSNFHFSSVKCSLSGINYSMPATYRTIQIKKTLDR